MFAKITTGAIAVTMLGAAQVHADSVIVCLNDEHQVGGNVGTEFRPYDVAGNPANFVMTARTMIDHNDPFNPNAAGHLGTVYIDDEGAGVQTEDGSGSKGISGGGGHKDEEIIFTFDNATAPESILLHITDFKAGDGLDDDDDPILFITFAGDANTLVLDETEYMHAFHSTGSKRGYIDFGELNLGGQVASFAIRETGSHIYVDGISAAAVPIPGALGLGLAGLAGLGIARRRRRTKAA